MQNRNGKWIMDNGKQVVSSRVLKWIAFSIVHFPLSTAIAIAQDSVAVDSAKMNVDAIYSRPFLSGNNAIGIGGYLEANVQSLNENGVGEGVSFQARRLTLFASASPTAKLKFLTEIEFENGTEEINIEFASLDFVFSNAFAVRGGIVLIPIGAFNQNHDGPRWNFIDRPISAIQLLPATWSAAGFGALGKFYLGGPSISYEAYLSNGMNEAIVSNDLRRTSLPAFKEDPERFAESFNGHMMFSARSAISFPKAGEFGLSYAGGMYSQSQADGLETGPELWAHVAAFDYAYGSFEDPLFIRTEWCMSKVDLPQAAEPSYGSMQFGGYTDGNFCIWRGPSLGFESTSVFLAARFEYVDFHLANTDADTVASGDETWSSTIGVAYHPASGTIVRLNYRTTWIIDVLGNPPSRQVAFQLGITTYF